MGNVPGMLCEIKRKGPAKTPSIVIPKCMFANIPRNSGNTVTVIDGLQLTREHTIMLIGTHNLWQRVVDFDPQGLSKRVKDLRLRIMSSNRFDVRPAQQGRICFGNSRINLTGYTHVRLRKFYDGIIGARLVENENNDRPNTCDAGYNDLTRLLDRVARNNSKNEKGQESPAQIGKRELAEALAQVLIGSPSGANQVA